MRNMGGEYMRIKVKKSKQQVWYHDRIGEEFEVEYDGELFVLTEDPFYKFYEDDCELIEGISTPRELDEEETTTADIVLGVSDVDGWSVTGVE